MSAERGLVQDGAVLSLDTPPRPGALPTKQVLSLARQDMPAQRYFAYIPSSGGAEAPILVAIHGLARNAEEHAHSFSALCETHGVVLVAPLFGEDSKDYQRLGRSGRGPRADVALDAILEELVLLSGATANPIYLFGHAAGAQFAHRYAMAHPHRVARAVVVSAGWYTFPNRRRRFPHGIRKSPDLPDVRFDAEEFLRVPMTVFVGEQATTSKNLRRGDKVDRQGRTRIERARNWVAAMRKASEKRRLEPLISLKSIPQADDTFASLTTTGRLGELAFEALFEVVSPNRE